MTHIARRGILSSPASSSPSRHPRPSPRASLHQRWPPTRSTAISRHRAGRHRHRLQAARSTPAPAPRARSSARWSPRNSAAPLKSIALVEGDTALTPNQGPTAGSTGIPVGSVTLRQAAATARFRLLALASARLNQPTAALQAIDGTIRGAGASISFVDLVGGQTFQLAVDKNVNLKDPADFRFIGKSIPRPDLPGEIHRPAPLRPRRFRRTHTSSDRPTHPLVPSDVHLLTLLPSACATSSAW